MQIKVILSTDLLSRGIDLPDVKLVINFDMPLSESEYFHRIGRTGRFGKDGVAISFIIPNDHYLHYLGDLIPKMNLINDISKFKENL
jgi:superfamily II DNA/RNA helicase